MSSCEGCFNGCSSIVSDRCVKYTGSPVTQWDIDTGAPLSEVEEKIFSYLVTVLSGTGIEPIIPSQYLCSLISKNLPSGDVNLVNILIALSAAVCELQSDINNIEGQLTALEADYTVSCLSGVTSSSNTHAVLQATITKLCSVYQSVLTLQSALNGYVKITELNARIQAYLDTLDTNKMYSKMVPYVAVEYYGPRSNYPTVADGFSIDGVGYGAWEYVYLCNGYNGLTPDKKGRIPIGCTSMGGNMDTEIDPDTPGNFEYIDPKEKRGSNMVTLGIANMPTHDHTAVNTTNDPGHRHLFLGDDNFDSSGGYVIASAYSPITSWFAVNHEWRIGNHYYTKSVNNSTNQSDQTTGVTVSTNIGTKGGGLAHSNLPPVMSCYYIMYIPPS